MDGEPPYVIKPAIKEHFFYATKCKAWRADTRAELIQRFRAAAALVGTEEVVIQELVPGDGDTQLAYCAMFKDDAPLASMVVKRLRQHPVDFGRASTFVRTVGRSEVEAMSLRFLRSIGYYGLVELEYKYDRRDGLTKLLDVNARTWGYHSLGQRAGVDFPYLLYADQIGRAARAASRHGLGSPGSASRPISRRPASNWRDAGSTGGPICGRCAGWTSSRYSRPTTYVQVSRSWPCCPISQSREESELIVDDVMTETHGPESDADGRPTVSR